MIFHRSYDYLTVYEYNGEKHFWFGLFGNWWLGYYLPANHQSYFNGFEAIDFSFNLKKIAKQIGKNNEFLSKESCVVNLREAFKKRIKKERECRKLHNKKRNTIVRKVWP